MRKVVLAALAAPSLLTACGPALGACVTDDIANPTCYEDWDEADCKERDVPGTHRFYEQASCRALGFYYYCSLGHVWLQSSEGC